MAYVHAHKTKQNSFFMFGARGTGKSTLINSLLGDKAYVIDLLDDETFDRYMTQPNTLQKIVETNKYDWIFIDEVQRLPELLNSVHKLIESHKQKFALTSLPKVYNSGLDAEKKACADVKKKYFDDFAKTKDLYLFLGTTREFHLIAPNPFVIIGVFYPKKVTQTSLF